MPSNEEDPLENILHSLESMVPDLDSISTEVNRITESVDKHFKAVASTLLEYPVAASIRDTIQSSSWLYERPRPSPPPPQRILPVTHLDSARGWVSEHRAVTAAVVAFIGTGVYLILRQRRADRTKRRALRAKTGSRKEVVVLAGSLLSSLTKSLALDLERRGFIVYIPVTSLPEEHLVQSESRPDIRPLHLDVSSEVATANAIEKFTSYIKAPQYPLPHTPPHNLQLSSLVLLPSLEPSNAPIATLSVSTWSDTLNANVIAPFAIIKAFLPLLVSQKASLLALTPSIVPSLKAASHAPQSVITASFDAHIATLRKEISHKDLNIVQVKLGSFDLGTSKSTERQMVATANIARAEHPGWDTAARAKHLKEQLNKLRNDRVKGSSLRELHNTVFDCVARGRGKGGTVFVGRGAWTYDLVGKWLPGGVVGWMMGLKQGRRNDLRPTEGSQEWEKVEHV
ncbi:MAG: hypothetical protein HETSPECPRED_004699 [Heterodermia speciosa]|uniref:DUF1776-domain-containing protein n=1 Tax=Heterodermia speciosa TaxID=116794 RepID=A0A8H3INV6_9LECA|nr:MAG: hypothetical protein HETSPECPRED_004699 [Heterodermia speciosa]